MATKAELLEQAVELDIEGRSTMSKAELEDAIEKAGGDVERSEEDAAPVLAAHEQAQAERDRPTGLRYREGR